MLQDAAAELKIELQSSELRKELRVTDLVFTQVLGIVGLGWIGTAGKLGSHQLMFWLAAIFLFYLPSAVVVIHLNNEMPLEGGLYQWAKLRFNEITGFLVAWNLWIYCVVMVSQVGLIVANNLSYAMGEPWIANSKPAMIGVSVVTIIGLVFVARVGFSVGRWVQGLCGFMLVALFVAMAVFALPRWFLKGAAHPPLALSLPTLTLINLNILSKIGFGALGGFDTIAMFAGECRASDAGATIRRSMWIATPVIAGAFVIGTACLLVFVKPEEIDLISPITQVLSRGMEFAGFSGSMAAIATALIVCTWLGAALLNINYASRLPMVAGWDHLLPEWCMRLHPEYRTPVGSIVFLGSVSLTIAVLSTLGVGNQEAFQILQSGCGLAFAFTYLVMFAIPLVTGEGPMLLRAAAVSGFLMTLLYVFFSVFPIVEVVDRTAFAAKIGGMVFALNAAGALLYWRAAARRRAGSS